MTRPPFPAPHLRLKRAYEPAAPDDGVRILIDRLWPRGVSKAEAALDDPMKEIAPSTELRQWFGHDPERWVSFAARYRGELARCPDLLRLLDELRRRGRVTLLYGARDEARNNAVVLRDVMEERCSAGKRARKASTR